MSNDGSRREKKPIEYSRLRALVIMPMPLSARKSSAEISRRASGPVGAGTHWRLLTLQTSPVGQSPSVAQPRQSARSVGTQVPVFLPAGTSHMKPRAQKTVVSSQPPGAQPPVRHLPPEAVHAWSHGPHAAPEGCAQWPSTHARPSGQLQSSAQPATSTHAPATHALTTSQSAEVAQLAAPSPRPFGAGMHASAGARSSGVIGAPEPQPRANRTRVSAARMAHHNGKAVSVYSAGDDHGRAESRTAGRGAVRQSAHRRGD